MRKKPERIIKEVEEKGVEFVRLQFVDITGRVRSLTIHTGQLGEAIEEGVGFDGSSVPGYAKIEKSDLVLIPDLETFKVLPWEIEGKRVARVFCTVCSPDGTPHGGDPRNVLERATATARKKGYEFFVGTEMEFYFFKEGKPLDSGGYQDTAPYDAAEELRTELALSLQKLGFIIETIHHEVSRGQNEVDFRYADALTTADNVVTCRQALEALAGEKGLKVDFSPKPQPKLMGNGLHCHHSLADPKTGENLFYDPASEYRMSELARYFLGGELEHAPALTAFAASTPNSYKRLVPGFEAPVYICWGGANRSVMVRVPGYEIRRGRGVRLEFRTPDPICNPYLLFTAMLAAGLDGIKRKRDPGPPVKENVYKFSEEKLKQKGISVLPKTLDEALDALERDEVIKKSLGEVMYNNYLEAKREEALKAK